MMNFLRIILLGWINIKGRNMKKNNLIEEILEKEWSYFSKLNNIGGRAET